MSRLGGYYMIPPGMRCAGTCRSAWTGGSSSSRTCAGSMEWKDEETTGGEREKKKESRAGRRRGYLLVSALWLTR
jgi:hypothetical protein